MPECGAITEVISAIIENILVFKFRAVYQFIVWVKQHGTAGEKTAALHFEFVCSISGFMDLVLHPKVGFYIALLISNFVC